MLAPYVLLFAACSLFGWIWESCWAIVSTGKWDRRGFLFGPICPIYGVGVVAIILIVRAIARQIGCDLEWWGIALVGFFGSMVLEYVTSWALERWFHAFWWDYADIPLNINGRTCVPAALLFSLGGLAAVYLIEPLWIEVIGSTPEVVVEILAYAVIVLISVDATLTVNALTEFQNRVVATYEQLNTQAEEATAKITALPEEAGERIAAFSDAARTRLSDERDRLLEEGVSAVVAGMDFALLATLKRVKGFRYTDQRGSARGIRLSTKSLNVGLSEYALMLKKWAAKRRK